MNKHKFRYVIIIIIVLTNGIHHNHLQGSNDFTFKTNFLVNPSNNSVGSYAGDSTYFIRPQLNYITEVPLHKGQSFICLTSGHFISQHLPYFPFHIQSKRFALVFKALLEPQEVEPVTASVAPIIINGSNG